MFQKFKNAINDIMEEFLYRYIHYDVKTSVALIYSKTKNVKTNIESRIRDTDRFVQISKHLFMVFYQYTNTDAETKAACENLIKRIDSNEKKPKTILAYTNFREEDKTVDSIINRLYIIFDEAVLKKEHIKSDKEFLEEYNKCHVDFKDI